MPPPLSSGGGGGGGMGGGPGTAENMCVTRLCGTARAKRGERGATAAAPRPLPSPVVVRAPPTRWQSGTHYRDERSLCAAWQARPVFRRARTADGSGRCRGCHHRHRRRRTGPCVCGVRAAAGVGRVARSGRAPPLRVATWRKNPPPRHHRGPAQAEAASAPDWVPAGVPPVARASARASAPPVARRGRRGKPHWRRAGTARHHGTAERPRYAAVKGQ